MGDNFDKDLVKEALKEWLDAKFSEFGRWALKSIAAAVFGYVLIFLVSHGFTPLSKG